MQICSQSKSVQSIESLFKEAFRLWNERLPNESPKIGSPTYDHFQKLGKAIGDQAINVYGGLRVKASVGMMGRWSEIPWIGLRNPYLTDNFQEGEYIVYLLSPVYNALYLGIIQGITKLTPDQLAERTPRLRKEIAKPDGFVVGLEGHLAVNSPYNSKPYKYELGLLYSKQYDMQKLSAEEILLSDLKTGVLTVNT
ncbi:MAG: DUF3578 domain-containing protein [Candidatus Bathyarchaeia archaeon]